jgi:hypothetical protein
MRRKRSCFPAVDHADLRMPALWQASIRWGEIQIS